MNVIKRKLINLKWRKINKHNFTVLGTKCEFSKIEVGRGTYGVLNVWSYGNKSEKLRIGSYCSIAADVHFLLGGEHIYSNISTYPYKVMYCGYECEAVCKGEVVVEDDVWIGHRATIMSGVHIGQGAIIATGAVVTKDVPPYAIVGGVPAKIIRYRFDEHIVEELKAYKYDSLSQETIKENIDLFYTDVSEELINKMKKRIY